MYLQHFKVGNQVVAMWHNTRYWGYVAAVSADERLITIEYYAGVDVGYKRKRFYSNEVCRQEW